MFLSLFTTAQMQKEKEILVKAIEQQMAMV